MVQIISIAHVQGIRLPIAHLKYGFSNGLIVILLTCHLPLLNEYDYLLHYKGDLLILIIILAYQLSFLSTLLYVSSSIVIINLIRFLSR